MDVMRVAGLSMASAVVALVLRRLRPEMGLAAALAAGMLVLGMALPLLGQLIEGVRSLARAGGVKDGYMLLLFKVAGISLLMDFAAQTCRDAGEEGLAMKAELAGRVVLLTLALPPLRSLLGLILSIPP